MSVETKHVVIPVGWFRVAVAIQVLMEWALGLALLVVLKWVTPELIYHAANKETAVAWVGYLEVTYLVVGALFLCYVGLFAKPPTAESFTRSKWWQAWVLTHAKLPTGRRASRDFELPEDSSGGMTVNPATGMTMAEGDVFDADGNVWGDSN